MKKLLFIAAVCIGAASLTSCEEEIILPTGETTTTTTTDAGGNGSQKTDPDQWD